MTSADSTHSSKQLHWQPPATETTLPLLSSIFSQFCVKSIFSSILKNSKKSSSTTTWSWSGSKQTGYSSKHDIIHINKLHLTSEWVTSKDEAYNQFMYEDGGLTWAQVEEASRTSEATEHPGTSVRSGQALPFTSQQTSRSMSRKTWCLSSYLTPFLFEFWSTTFICICIWSLNNLFILT